MSTLNPLAIALQGLGFGAAQIALQGLLTVIDEIMEQEEYRYSGSSLSRHFPALRQRQRKKPAAAIGLALLE